MMRWKLWDNNQGEPPEYAVQTSDGMYMVLQQEVTVYREDSIAYFAGEYMEWQDIPLHIESKS